jgi:hypothetical protein
MVVRSMLDSFLHGVNHVFHKLREILRRDFDSDTLVLVGSNVLHVTLDLTTNLQFECFAIIRLKQSGIEGGQVFGLTEFIDHLGVF